VFHDNVRERDMSLSYTIDREQQVVRTRGWGSISASEVRDWISHLLADPLFDPCYRELSDLRSVTEVTVGSMELAEAAATPLFDACALRAVVATSDCVFGMARMFASFAERMGHQVRVFRCMDLAEAWLGLRIDPAGGAPNAEVGCEPLAA